MDYRIIYQQDSLSSEQVQIQADSVPGRPVWERNSVTRTSDSGFINPLTEFQLSSSHVQQKPRLVLPAYEKASLNTDWLTIVLFGVILVFASVRYSYITYIKHVFTSLFNYPTAVRLFQESNYPASHAAHRLDLIFYIILSVFVFQTFNVLGIAGAGNQLLFYLFSLAGVLVYFFGKRFIYHTISSLFETRAETGEYLFNMSNFNRALGIVFIPLVALVSFSPANDPRLIVFSGITIYLVFQLLLLQRGVLILLRKQFSILYLFLYLCTLEFLPLLLIYKVVVVE